MAFEKTIFSINAVTTLSSVDRFTKLLHRECLRMSTLFACCLHLDTRAPIENSDPNRSCDLNPDHSRIPRRRHCVITAYISTFVFPHFLCITSGSCGACHLISTTEYEKPTLKSWSNLSSAQFVSYCDLLKDFSCVRADLLLEGTVKKKSSVI